MSIKGLTDRGMSFPEIGQIRKGAPKPDDPKIKKPGSDLQYFRVEFDEKEAKRAALFVQKYGSHPDEINILLPFNEVEKCWDAWFEAYTAGRMVARSDGEKFVYLLDLKTNKPLIFNGLREDGHPEPHRGVIGTYTTSTGKVEEIKCKPTGRLKVVIPELKSLAFLTVHTTSLHDIINISEQLEAIKQINGGRLAGIPLVLRRRPKKISTPNADGTRARRVKYLISIEADPEWVKAALLEMKHLALPGNGMALLPESTQTTPEPDDRNESNGPDWDDEDEDEDTGEGEETQGEEPEGEIVPEEVILAMDFTTSDKKRLGDMTVDELTILKEKCEETPENKRGDNWRKSYGHVCLVLTWRTRPIEAQS